MATYNRPSVLAFAIESVLAQEFADWELIVIGDACADETAALVNSFGDPRITYVNLVTNFGEQSVPAMSASRGHAGRTLPSSTTTTSGFPIICAPPWTFCGRPTPTG